MGNQTTNQAKLGKGVGDCKYKTLKEVEDDARLIVSNCRAYNTVKGYTSLLDAATKFESKVDTLFAAAPVKIEYVLALAPPHTKQLMHSHPFLV